MDTEYLRLIDKWRELLAGDILAHPKRHAWVRNPDGSINLPVMRAAVQRYLDRLVIIRFAEDHNVIRYGSLHQLAQASQNEYAFTLERFIDRFFRQFDLYHNSGLFVPAAGESAFLSDDILARLVEDLYRARYRAMSADILGNTYEQYLGRTLVLTNGRVTTRDNLETRKKQGSYYTPQVIVRYIVDNSLGRYLYGTVNGKPDGEPKIYGQNPLLSESTGGIWSVRLNNEFHMTKDRQLFNTRQHGIPLL